MPELAEVETIRLGLLSLIGQELIELKCHRSNLRYPLPLNALQNLQDRTLLDLERRGKYLLWHFSQDQSMLMHLGMSGHVILHPIQKKREQQKHDHVLMTWNSESHVIFNDPRRFGFITVLPTEEMYHCNHLKHLGPEPLSGDFNDAYLAKLLKNKKAPIKNILMDQRAVAGLGNIYCCESLFHACIHPSQSGMSLKSKQIKNLVASVKQVLYQAIESGGSSLRDYRNAKGELGYFQHQWSVYDKEGQACSRCRNPIERFVLAGRSTFFCPNHQMLVI